LPWLLGHFEKHYKQPYYPAQGNKATVTVTETDTNIDNYQKKS